MSNIDSRVERAKRRLFARIIACAHLLDKPFSDAPDQSPWTRLKADMTALDEALKQQAPDVVAAAVAYVTEPEESDQIPQYWHELQEAVRQHLAPRT